MTSSLESLRECCKNQKFFLIIFDGADTAALPILVCHECATKTVFQQFVISKFNITKQINIAEILNNFLGD